MEYLKGGFDVYEVFKMYMEYLKGGFDVYEVFTITGRLSCCTPGPCPGSGWV
jgi:hypothetical protein